MNKKAKRKLSIYDIAKPKSEEEIKEDIRNTNIGLLLGILPMYYDTPSRNYEIIIPSNYKTEHEYGDDKHLANIYLLSGKQVPKDLANRLIIARRDLEKRGLKKPIDESKIMTSLKDFKSGYEQMI